MNTEKVRPILFEMNNESDIFRKKGSDLLEYELYNKYQGAYIGYQLIFISLNPDEKIEKGDLFYDTHSKIINNASVNFGRIGNDSAKKVMATQDQIPEEYIQQFISEYNENNVNDVKIECEELCKYGRIILPKSPYNNESNSDMSIYFNRPKLTNGFISIKKNQERLLNISDIMDMLPTKEEIEDQAKTYDNPLASISEAIIMPQGFKECVEWVIKIIKQKMNSQN
jgi:hypothetical protein